MTDKHLPFVLPISIELEINQLAILYKFHIIYVYGPNLIMLTHVTSVPAWKQELLEKRRLNDEECQRRRDEEIRRLQVNF